jgi:hypothetical protein|tara:strand:+ start:708 stop:1058 length:351 start_codon:yes stop_codon:yes gene_type:complete
MEETLTNNYKNLLNLTTEKVVKAAPQNAWEDDSTYTIERNNPPPSSSKASKAFRTAMKMKVGDSVSGLPTSDKVFLCNALDELYSEQTKYRWNRKRGFKSSCTDKENGIHTVWRIL